MKIAKIALTCTFTLLLFLAVTGATFVDLSMANFFPEQIPPGIRINGNGTVEGTDNIQRSGNVYTLTANISQTIVILRDNIVLDGAGYTLEGDGDGTGIFLQERNDVTIRDLKIQNFDYGIKFTWLNYVTPTSPRSNKVSGNIITNNTNGITFGDLTSGDEVSDNYITDNMHGVVSARNAIFRNNRFDDNKYATSEPSLAFNDIDTSNTVNGKPIYYWVNQHDKTVPSDAGLVVLKNCSGITVQGLSLKGNGDGVLLYQTMGSTISGNVIGNNVNGITLTKSSYNIISDNQIQNNKEYGILVESSSTSNVMSRNEIINNMKDGLYFDSSAINNSVTENHIIENNGNGIFFIKIQDSSVIANNITLNKGAGISFGWGSNGTIKGNYISKNEKGIWVGSAFENTITFNTIIENSVWGVELGDTQRDNIIHHNNFVNNNITGGEQVYIASLWTFPGEPEPPKYVEGAANAWDDGIEGNYWSDYFTTYTNASEANNSRIGNTPVYINSNISDNYPLSNMVDITEIPEFPPWVILPLFLIATLFATVIRKKIYRKNNT